VTQTEFQPNNMHRDDCFCGEVMETLIHNIKKGKKVL
jgi:hypothetical protein